VPIEVLADLLVTHWGTWIGVASDDLDVREVRARVETGRERFTNRAECL